MPEQDPPVNLTEQDMEQLIKARSRTTLARLAQSAPACGAPDQFGFQTREHLAPMLHNPVLGQLTVDAILDPISRGYLPTMYSDIFRGGRLVAISKGAKGGARPIVVGDACRRLDSRALAEVSKLALANWCTETYPNTVQFAAGTKVGAEKFLGAVMLALGGDPAPTVSPEDLEADPEVVIVLDSKNAFNTLDRQIIVDVLTHSLSRDYGELTQDNLPDPPELFKIHFPLLKAYYDGPARLAFHDPRRRFHILQALTGVHQGDVYGSQFYAVGTLPIVGSAMAAYQDVLAAL